MKIIPLSRAERLELIEKLANSRTEGTYPVTFQKAKQNLGIHRVDISAPAYRIRNGRTRGMQLEEVSLGNVAADFFTDPDSTEVQQKQDELLRELIKDAGLVRILQTEEQRLPLILDSQGYVVNGNRRLCAMRKLLELKPEEYSRYRHIDIVILPVCSEDDILELEGELQVAPEGKSAYDWVAQALWIRDRKNEGWSDRQSALVYKMNVTKIAELQQMLAAGEVYLEWLGTPNLYHELKKKDYAFKKIVQGRKRLSKTKGSDDVALFTELAHKMVKGDPSGRLYQSIPELERNLDQIKKALITALPEPGPTQAQPDRSDLDILTTSPPSKSRDLLVALKTPESAKKALLVVDDVIASHKAVTKKSASKTAGRINKIETAVALLREAAAEKSNPAHREILAGLVEQARLELEQIEADMG